MFPVCLVGNLTEAAGGKWGPKFTTLNFLHGIKGALVVVAARLRSAEQRGKEPEDVHESNIKDLGM